MCPWMKPRDSIIWVVLYRRNMAGLSPMMSQYMDTKKEYPDCILFYRLGDFYEMFFEDALLVSRELELTLTGKECGLEERAPMCGVPHHSVDTYLQRLVEKGYKVAIAEQMEDAKFAKGLVKREVVKIVTPGTLTSDNNLQEDKNHFLMSIVYNAGRFGIACVDISTGDFFVSEADNLRILYDEINKFYPSEIISNYAIEMSGMDFEFIKNNYALNVSKLNDEYFAHKNSEEIILKQFAVPKLFSLGLDAYPEGQIAAAAILRYLYETQKSSCAQINSVKAYKTGEYMLIDTNSKRNLELVETMRDKKKHGSLLWLMDATKTAMGARLLRNYVEQPLINVEKILERQDAIAELLSKYVDREELREYLDAVYDLERLMSKVSTATAGSKDLLALSDSIAILKPIKNLLNTFDSNLLRELNQSLDLLSDIYDIINRSINEDAPLSLKEGNLIKTAYSEEIDKLRLASTQGKQWLAELEESERTKTGIKLLRIKYNKVFGYYFEVTNSYKSQVPDYFIRRQTLSNAERYTTEKLKELEELILGAQDKLFDLEYGIFVGIRQSIAGEIIRIQKTAKVIAQLDVLQSLAHIAYKHNFTRPDINTKGIIDIKDGRHPVIEKIVGDDKFIANDTYLDSSKHRMSIITGPNMAGKSTYMRQTALIVLMAQIGSYVPASYANISICDRIFTRVGASDDLASGQSTFMVEMTEVSNILRNATRNSLVILDEIGRGTSTFDGLSIAWAVVEHISNTKLLGAKTLFATHYHELTELEGVLPGVNNYCVSVSEHGDDIVFLRKIVKGGADKSYGIQVAKLAGVPDVVIERAKELAAELDNLDLAKHTNQIISADKKHKAIPRQNELEAAQLSFSLTTKDDDIIEELKAVDIGMLTPIDALNTLYRLQNKIKNRI